MLNIRKISVWSQNGLRKVLEIGLFIKKARSISSPGRNFGAAATEKKMVNKKEKDNIVRTNERAYSTSEIQRNNSRQDRGQIVANII